MGYAELAAQDLEQARRDFRLRLVVSLLLVVAAVFAIFFGCLVIIALTWDTPNRVAAIAGIAGFFAIVALICAVYRAKVVGNQTPFLSTVRREWAEDRVILDNILSDQE